MKTIAILLVALAIYMIYKSVPVFYKTKARTLYSKGEYHKSKAIFEKLVKSSSNDVSLVMEYTYLLLKMGEYEDAERVINTILCKNLSPQTRSKAVILRCMCYDRNNNFDEAYSDACELYESGYRSMDLYSLLGYFKLKKNPASKETYDFCAEAYDYADDNRDICDNMLMCYYYAKDYDKAKELSDEIIENNPRFVEGYYHSAQLYVAMGESDLARSLIGEISNCDRSGLTTVSQSEIDELSDSLQEVNE